MREMTVTKILFSLGKKKLLRSRDPRKKSGGAGFKKKKYSMNVTQYLMTVIQFMASLGPKMADKALK